MKEMLFKKSAPVYKRVILKLSGESLKDGKVFYSAKAAEFIAEEIKSILEIKVQVGIVIGGGNVIRGHELEKQGIHRSIADNMGMVITINNALFLQDILEKKGINTRVQSAIEVKKFSELYIPRRAIRHFEKERVVILAGGTGNAYCTTDNAAVIRAYELRADAVLKGTKVDGLFNKDPFIDSAAKLIPKISHKEMFKFGFEKIIDNQAIGIIIDAKDKIPIHIFNIFKKGNLRRVVCGEKIGSKVY
jgi:uridylate kinase